MTGPTCVAGVDGGGTRTRALLLAPDGARMGQAEGSAALVSPADPAAAARVVAATVRRAAADMTFPLPALWAGLAGAGRREVQRRVEEVLLEEGVAARVRVGSDVEAAFHDAFGGGPGIIVVAGTGSVVVGVGADGRRVQVGGWGRVMGDEGSAYHIGVMALRAVARATDGRALPTRLSDLLADHLGLAEARALPSWAEAAAKADIAGLAPVVIRAARTGDRAARRVVRTALHQLGEQLAAAIRILHPKPASSGTGNLRSQVALSGGLLAPGRLLHREAARMVVEAGARLLRRAVVPERGAARLALTLLG